VAFNTPNHGSRARQVNVGTAQLLRSDSLGDSQELREIVRCFCFVANTKRTGEGRDKEELEKMVAGMGKHYTHQPYSIVKPLIFQVSILGLSLSSTMSLVIWQLFSNVHVLLYIILFILTFS